MIPITKENKLVHKLRNNIYIEAKFCIEKILKKVLTKIAIRIILQNIRTIQITIFLGRRSVT